MFGVSDNIDSSIRFYVGSFLNINLDILGIRPELNYAIVKDFDQFQIPVLLQLGLGNKLSVVAGESFNLGIDLGLALVIGEKFSIEVRYILEQLI